MRAKFDSTGRAESDPDVLREDALKDRLAKIAVNTEIQHAHLAPEDFNEDARQAGSNPMPPVRY